MNKIIIEVADFQSNAQTPTQPDKKEKQVESGLLRKMKNTYDDYFENNYKPKLYKDSKNEPIYPEFNVIIDEEVYEIVFDYDFYESLCRIYIIEGWSGISVIEKKLTDITNDESKELSGGVIEKKWTIDVHPKETSTWNLAKSFFNYTQKMLALLIRETLAKIERLSAEQIISKLSIANLSLTNAISEYDIQPPYLLPVEVPTWYDRDAPMPTSYAVEPTYWLKNQAMSKDLFGLLTLAFQAKYDFDFNTIKANEDTQIIEDISRGKGRTVIDDPFLLQELQIDLSKILSRKDASEKLLNSLQNLLKSRHPLGLLIYGSLEKGFEKSRMEYLFGLTLNTLRSDLESLGRDIDPRVLQTEKLLPFAKTEDLKDVYNEVLDFPITPEGVENHVLETSLVN